MAINISKSDMDVGPVIPWVAYEFFTFCAVWVGLGPSRSTPWQLPWTQYCMYCIKIYTSRRT